MTKTAFIRARIEPDLKSEVDKILENYGVSTTQVVNMLYRRIKRTGELPAELFVPNAQTARAIKEAKAGKGVIKCKNREELFKKLGM